MSQELTIFSRVCGVLGHGDRRRAGCLSLPVLYYGSNYDQGIAMEGRPHEELGCAPEK